MKGGARKTDSAPTQSLQRGRGQCLSAPASQLASAHSLGSLHSTGRSSPTVPVSHTMKLLNHPLQVTQGDPSVHATEAGAVAFVGSTVTLAKCLVRRCLPVSVCWPLCRHEQMLMRNLVPSVCSRAIAHICDKGDNLAKQTLWLLLFLLATNQLFPLLVSGGRKNSSGLRSRRT